MRTYKSRLAVFILLVFSFIVYSLVLYSKEQFQEIIPTENADAGRLLWQDKNCQACHQIYGLGGHLGPDLTNVYSRHDTDYIFTILSSGTAVMPNFNLSQEEIEHFLEFFKYINSTGTYKPALFKRNLDGTISEP